MPDDSGVAQDDLAEILRALGLGDHARPQSPHGLVQTEVLPRIRQLKAADPCAEFPDAPEPEPYRPAPGTRARHGRKEAPNIYLHTDDNLKGLCIGRLDKPEYAALAIEALNVYLAFGRGWEYGVRTVYRDLDGDQATTTWFESERAARETIERAELHPSGRVLSVQLVRRPVLYGPVEEVQGSG